jgi:hypothetical protein
VVRKQSSADENHENLTPSAEGVFLGNKIRSLHINGLNNAYMYLNVASTSQIPSFAASHSISTPQFALESQKSLGSLGTRACILKHHYDPYLQLSLYKH